MSSTDAPPPRPDGPQAGPATRERGGAVAARVAAAPRMSWLTLALMTTSSVASLRSAPTMAVYGLACVFLYLVPALVFAPNESVDPGEIEHMAHVEALFLRHFADAARA